MKRVLTAMAAAGGMSIIAADVASAQSLGGFPIREPGAGYSSGKPTPTKGKKGPLQIIVDINGPGPYKSIAKAVDDVAEGGVVYVMHGVYNESITLDKSVTIQGDRGPGSGVEINAPINKPCLEFSPEKGTAHAAVANVNFFAKINSSADACVNIKQGVFTMTESDIFGATAMPTVKITGGTVTLKKNRISAGSQGVFVAQAHSLMNTSIIDNKISNNGIGVDIAAGSRADVVVAGNEIFNNLSNGVSSDGFGEASLIGNKIRNNKGTGIHLNRFSKLSLVRYNEIVQNNGDGVGIPFGVNGIIEDNQIVGNAGLSIFIREGLEPKITNNYIDNNDGDNNGKKKKKRRRNNRLSR